VVVALAVRAAAVAAVMVEGAPRVVETDNKPAPNAS
jgi:hypothetical protein